MRLLRGGKRKLLPPNEKSYRRDVSVLLRPPASNCMSHFLGILTRGPCVRVAAVFVGDLTGVRKMYASLAQAGDNNNNDECFMIFASISEG